MRKSRMNKAKISFECKTIKEVLNAHVRNTVVMSGKDMTWHIKVSGTLNPNTWRYTMNLKLKILLNEISKIFI